jgi:hypothetical protein
MVKDPATGEFVHTGLDLHEFLDVSLREKEDAKFLGNCDIDAVRAFISENHDRIPFFYLTITNNKGGGQPVSLGHIRAVSDICHAHNIPLLFDACRFAENAWFIQRDEEPSMSIQEIIHSMFECVDGFHSSFKKDGIVNMGGGLIIKPTGMFAKRYIIKGLGQMLTDHQILTEGLCPNPLKCVHYCHQCGATTHLKPPSQVILLTAVYADVIFSFLREAFNSHAGKSISLDASNKSLDLESLSRHSVFLSCNQLEGQLCTLILMGSSMTKMARKEVNSMEYLLLQFSSVLVIASVNLVHLHSVVQLRHVKHHRMFPAIS